VSSPGRSYFYSGETVSFSGAGSYDQDESGASITYYEWYVDGTYKAGGSSKSTWTTSFSVASGQTTVQIKLKVTGDRIETDSPGFVRGRGRIIFNAGTEEGRQGLYNFFFDHPDQVPSFIANENFSDQSKLIALNASRESGAGTFFRYTYHITVSWVTIVSAASGVGAVTLGIGSLAKGGGGILAKRLSKLSLRASGTEFGLRTTGFGAGIDSGTNVGNAFIGAIGGRMLNSSALVGVNYTNLNSPLFRSVNTGRFVSNTYGGVRIGITSGAQLGLIYGLNQEYSNIEL